VVADGSTSRALIGKCGACRNSTAGEGMKRVGSGEWNEILREALEVTDGLQCFSAAWHPVSRGCLS
jgi:hypothetical protein